MAGMKRKAKKVAGMLLEADGVVAEAARPHSESLAVRAISLLSEIGDQPPMRALCVSAFGAGLATGSPRLMRAGIRMLAAHTLATLAKDFVKLRVDRTRPREDGNHALQKGRQTGKESTSFPSGHSAGALAAARAYAREFPEHKAAAYAGAGAIALAQIPRCAHYPTDVGSGLGIGWLADMVVTPALDAAFDSLNLSDDPSASLLPRPIGR
jgi:membrane-associated phospholipid phosphatase